MSCTRPANNASSGLRRVFLARQHVGDGRNLEAVPPDPFRLLVEDLHVLRGLQLLHRQRDGRRAHDVVAHAQHRAANVRDILAARVHRDGVGDLDQPRGSSGSALITRARRSASIDGIGERRAHADRRAGKRGKRDLLGGQVGGDALQEGVRARCRVVVGVHGGWMPRQVTTARPGEEWTTRGGQPS